MRRWRGAVQFLLAVGVILLAGYAVDPIAERFRRKATGAGWQRFRPPHETSALAREGDRLWAGGRDGLSVFAWRTAEIAALPAGVPRLERVRGLLVAQDGSLWVAHMGGIEHRSSQGWTHAGDAAGPAAAILQRRNGELWAGGEKGLARRDGARFVLVRDTTALGMEGVDALLEDRAGNLWAASAHPVRGGAGRVTPEGVWQSFTRDPGLAHSTVSSLFEDRAGGIWFASGFGRQGAACRLHDGRWSRFTRNDGLASDRTRLVYEDGRGRLWVASEVDGTAVRIGNRWRVLTPHDGMTGWEVKCMSETPDGALWMGTEDGVMRYDGTAELMREGTPQ